jgi:hypothetical protein
MSSSPKLAPPRDGPLVGLRNFALSLVVLTVLGVGQKVFGEDFLAILVDLAEGDGSESCPLRGKGKSSDAAKEVEMGWLFMGHGARY